MRSSECHKPSKATLHVTEAAHVGVQKGLMEQWTQLYMQGLGHPYP